MQIFIIIKKGVYRHDIFGVFDNFEKARKQADYLANTDKDNYHAYEIIGMQLNKSIIPKSVNDGTGHYNPDDVPIYTVTKSK